MKIALVHDYIKEYGGAERVLEVLHEMYPDAPIYTAFYDKKSTAYEHFNNAKIVSSWFGMLPFASKLASPLRFLTPLIWGSFDFSSYDVVISSASWYITKGFGVRGSSRKKPIEICYCHTPPRWLYGYNTSVNFQKYGIVALYARIVGHFLRKYDIAQAQKVNTFIANSKETQERIKKFYKRESVVIYPPVSLSGISPRASLGRNDKQDYYFIVSRLVGAKGLEMAVEAALKGEFRLKIAGSQAGYYSGITEILNQVGDDKKKNIELLGHVSDVELARLYKGAKAFLALAKDEDFGITPVEAMMSGTPVIAFNGGGYKETVVDGKTGVFFNEYSVEGLLRVIKGFEKMKIKPEDCIAQAEKFSKERFEERIRTVISSAVERSQE